jgi:hypothetical protein
MLAAYVAGMVLMPVPEGNWYKYTLSELGVIELGTAALYLGAAVVALLLVVRQSRAGRVYRAMYLLVALGAVFIFLEEINYGQYLLGFETPDYFMDHSSKEEFNLHNLFGNKPARRLNTLATIGFPLWCVALPLIGRWRGNWWTTDHWSSYLVPRMELATTVILAQLMSWVDDVYDWFPSLPENAWSRASEFKELYWSLAALLMMVLLWRRLRPRGEGGAA